MDEFRPVTVIGAGQAGLATSWWLTAHGVPHVVLERGQVADRWRSQRWDSFRLLSPNWQTRLPGHRYQGPEPDGFMTGAQVAAFLDGYARSFGAPVRTGVEVIRVRPGPAGWRVTTSDCRGGGRSVIDSGAVVVAAGDLAVPRVPALAAALPARIRQLDAGAYRGPADAVGEVLVVGAGPSGQQIARELAATGRRVHLAVGRHKALPRRYRGRDTYWWMDRLGMLARPVDSLPGGRAPRRTPNAVLGGGIRDLDVPSLVAEGVIAHGRLLAVDDGSLHFADDLAATVATAAQNADRFRAAVDAHVDETGLPAPAEAAAGLPAVGPGPSRLDLAGIGTVIWATGFRRDLSWLDAPVLDAEGEPEHERGVTAAPGLYFVGVRWQSRRSSSSWTASRPMRGTSPPPPPPGCSSPPRPDRTTTARWSPTEGGRAGRRWFRPGRARPACAAGSARRRPW
jgi:putative flavoprotein involved in K+ transport